MWYAFLSDALCWISEHTVALHSLYCTDVPLRNCSLTHSLTHSLTEHSVILLGLITAPSYSGRHFILRRMACLVRQRHASPPITGQLSNQPNTLY